jgi:hypothetical protein
MSRRVSRAAIAAVLALTLSLSMPSAAFAASRDGFDRSFGTRIVRILKMLGKKFGIVSMDVDVSISPTPPKP